MSLILPITTSNNNGIIVHIYFKQWSFLITGDIDQASRCLIRSNLVNHYTFLKLGHHGSRLSNSMAFLQTIQPNFV